jgi:hypothetical protein
MHNQASDGAIRTREQQRACCMSMRYTGEMLLQESTKYHYFLIVTGKHGELSLPPDVYASQFALELVKESMTGTARDAIAYPATASVHCSPTSKHDPLSPLLLQPTRWSVGQEHGRFRLFREAGGQGLTWGNIAKNTLLSTRSLN